MNTLKRCITFLLMIFFVMVSTQGVCLAEDLISWQKSMIKGTVVNINMDARKITLKDGVGSILGFTVDQKVGNLGSIAVGDRVTGHYCIAYTINFRRPTDQEIKTPFMVLGKTDAAVEDATPGTRVKLFKALVSVEHIDSFVGMISLMNSEGEVLVVFDRGLIDKANIYNTAIATYTEPLIVSLEN